MKVPNARGELLDPESSDYHAIDASMKALLRTCPAALLQLAGMRAAPDTIRIEDSNINLPEQRADHVFIVPSQAEPGGERAIYCEYQLTPDSRLLSTWFSKCGGLTRQLMMPVVLLVVYLERGDRASFPDRYIAEVDGLKNEYIFPTLRLWEVAHRIRSGEFAALAPLLVLCDEEPSTATVQEEIALIDSADLSVDLRSDLLAIVLRIAASRLSLEALRPLFIEETEHMKDTGFIGEWLAESEAKGERNIIIRQGSRRFGPPSEDVLERLSKIESTAELEALSLRLLEVESWQELLAASESSRSNDISG
jgi:predicted transposase YdaD